MLYDLMKDYNEKGRLLLKAADYMDEHGHCRCALRDSKGRVCLWGAIIYAAEFTDRTPFPKLIKSTAYECFESVSAVLRQRGSGNNPIDWNNQPWRTKDAVVALLRETAETEKLVTA